MGVYNSSDWFGSKIWEFEFYIDIGLTKISYYRFIYRIIYLNHTIWSIDEN